MVLLIDWTIDWLLEQLFDWLIDWYADSLSEWCVDWFADWLLLIELIDGFIDCLGDWIDG